MEEFRGYSVRWGSIPVGRRRYELLMPTAPERLLEDPDVCLRFDEDEYLPYWATLWPAGLALAEAVARWGDVTHSSDPPTVLELGCGLGLVGLVALDLGYRVILSDYDEDALAFARVSAERNRLPVPETPYVDWRKNYADLRPARILAADVLYEARNLTPVARFIRAHLKRGGFALVGDAYRSTADAFAEVANAAGLSVSVRDAFATMPRPETDCDATSLRCRIFELRHKNA